MYHISRNEIDSDSGRSYLLNQAKAYALCHEPDECRKNLDMCLPFLEKRKRDLAIYWQWLSRSYYVECVFTKAVECIEKAQKLVEESDSDLLPGILRWKAEYYWQLEQIDSAKECATLALKSANASKERVEIAASYLILGSVACFNREQKARELFQKSLDLLEEIDSQYELAMARRSAGCSGVYPIEESCQLLNQANEYFDREQIPRLSDSYTEDILFRIAVLQSSPSQQKRIAEILNSDQIR